MNTDIRLVIGFFDHKKTQRLRNILGHEGVECLIRLWMDVAQNRPEGELTGWDSEDIELAAHWKGEKNKFFNTISSEKCHWIDSINGVYSIHDWEEHQPYVVHAKERSEHARQAVSVRWKNKTTYSENTPSILDCNLSNTPSPAPSPAPSPIPEKDISFVSKQTETNSLLSGGLTAGISDVSPQTPPIVPEAPKKKKQERKKLIYSEGFEEFWKAYPRPVGKATAFESWEKIPKKHEGVTARKIVNAIIAQVKAKHFTNKDGDFIPLPATWLNQGRWDDVIKAPQTQERKGSARIIP